MSDYKTLEQMPTEYLERILSTVKMDRQEYLTQLNDALLDYGITTERYDKNDSAFVQECRELAENKLLNTETIKVAALKLGYPVDGQSYNGMSKLDHSDDIGR